MEGHSTYLFLPADKSTFYYSYDLHSDEILKQKNNFNGKLT